MQSNCVISLLAPTPKVVVLQGESPSALDKVVRVINSQLQALSSIDRRTDELEARLATLAAA